MVRQSRSGLCGIQWGWDTLEREYFLSAGLESSPGAWDYGKRHRLVLQNNLNVSSQNSNFQS